MRNVTRFGMNRNCPTIFGRKRKGPSFFARDVFLRTKAASPTSSQSKSEKILERMNQPCEFITWNLAQGLRTTPTPGLNSGLRPDLKVDDFLRIFSVQIDCVETMDSPFLLRLPEKGGICEVHVDAQSGLVSSLIPNYGSSRDVGHLKVSDETIADIREKRLPKRFVRSVVDSLKKKNVGESIVFWIQQQGKLDQVFQVNPYFDLELAVQSRLRRYIENGGNGLDTSPMKSFAQSEISTALPDVQDTIVIVPDVHGSLERTQAVERLLATKKFEWLALEMIPHTLQPELNEFSRSLSTSESFAKARNALNDYFLTSWDEWFTLRTKPASTESQGFRVIDSAKAANTRIIGLDTSDAYERLADPLTMGVRNLLWASLIPRSGNGIVLGGALHFSDLPKGLMLQDFIWERQSERKLYSVTFS